MKEITVQYVQEKYLFRVISRLQTDMEKVESKIVWSCTKLGLLTGAALGILICFFANFDGVLALFFKWIGTILLSAILVGVGGFVLG